MLREIVDKTANVHPIMKEMLLDIHLNGPIKPEYFERLAYVKKYHPVAFRQYESRLIHLLGLFFKVGEPQNILEAVYNSYTKIIHKETGLPLTPVQASIYHGIVNKVYFSFSAPTSTGKSHLFREIIRDFKDDIVIVVPSRALIAEYMATILKILENDKTVLVMQFVENVNLFNVSRRIYIITPERGGELFKLIPQLNIGLFLFDEAQIADEPLRGMTFDAFVRRVDKLLPDAKKVFTHPFVDNPDAQLKKHHFNKFASAIKYEQHSVGKIFLSFVGETFKYFSPYSEGKEASRIETIDYDPIERILSTGRTLLVYVSKSQIYRKEHIGKHKKYIELCSIIADPEARKIISELRNFIGASKVGEPHSTLIELMERGIVIHHGSIPLKARLLIEKFVNQGYAKICFATSTLIQGINMPFDAVWIDHFKFYGSEAEKILGMKNLIGRAGRTTQIRDNFDFGYVIIKDSNRKTFSRRMKLEARLKEKSLLDEEVHNINEDQLDIVEAVKTDSFNSDLNLTEAQIERIKEADITSEIKLLLDHLIDNSRLITETQYRAIEKRQREEIKISFQKLYLSHLRKQILSKREKSILSTAVSIMLWRVQGKSFKEIVSLRYSYLARKTEQREIDVQCKRGEISVEEALAQKRRIKIEYSQQADRLPSSETGSNRLFAENDSILDLDYDKLVYDTYDYLDKVIAQSLVDPITGALQIFYERTGDRRALVLSNYIKFGTNDLKEIWLLRYGFESEDIEWLKDHIISVDEYRINFKSSIDDFDEYQKRVIERFV